MCRKRGWHREVDCEKDPIPNPDEPQKFKKLRSGLLNTRERDAPAPQKAIVKRNLAVSPLLSLPPELRNRIYDLVLGGKRLWIGYSPHEHKYKTTRGRRERIHIAGGLYYHVAGGLCYHERSSLLKTLNIGLLRVCRQTYGEAALMLYALNKFAFENNWVRRKFEKGMRPAQMRAIGNYKIMDWERYSLGRTRMTSYPRSYGAQRTWR